MQLLLRLYWTVKNFGNDNNSRTTTLLINTFSSLFLKGFSIFVNFIFVPLCLKAVSAKEYGIVLTITSIASWIAFFDFGIGNGLRNKLSQALVENNIELAKKYVSTAFYYITIIFIGILLVYSVAHPFINWSSLLNISPADVPHLSSCIYLVIALFIIRFILQLISVILLADQKIYYSDAIMPLANFLTLIVIFILYKTHAANFYNLILAISAAPILILIIYNIVFLNGKYKFLRPSFTKIDHSLRKELLTLGSQFFLLQICVIIIFSTSEFLIANLFKIEDVTTFNIAYKYYGIVFLLSSMVISPLWSAFSNAWYQNDLEWITSMIKRIHLINGTFIIINISLFFAFEPLTKLWLGQSLTISNYFAFTLIIYNAQLIFNNVFSLFLNSIGKLALQLITGIGGAVINIPVTIFLARYTHLGLASICIANIISLLPGSILTSIQTYRILKQKGEDLQSL